MLETVIFSLWKNEVHNLIHFILDFGDENG